jgi:hypothetical protein
MIAAKYEWIVLGSLFFPQKYKGADNVFFDWISLGSACKKRKILIVTKFEKIHEYLSSLV